MWEEAGALTKEHIGMLVRLTAEDLWIEGRLLCVGGMGKQYVLDGYHPERDPDREFEDFIDHDAVRRCYVGKGSDSYEFVHGWEQLGLPFDDCNDPLSDDFPF